MKPTLRQKYDYLCSKLRITDIDNWEDDALISLPERIYFQFSINSPPLSVDEAVAMAMNDWYTNLEKTTK